MDRGGGMAASYTLATTKSSFHDRCVPQTQRNAGTVQPSKTKSEAEFSKCDHVSGDKIWRQSVDGEKRCLKNWETNWGFLTEFDPKGEPIEKEELPENMEIYSDKIPNTISGHYGREITTETGKAIQKMEFQFYSERRRKKLGSDLICY